METGTRITAGEEHSGRRLDLFVPILFPELSRTAARKLLDSGMIRVNGAVEYRPNYKVQTGDEVSIYTTEVTKKKRLPVYKTKLSVVYQDEHIVVVNKPAGMKVHPAGQKDNKTLLNALYHEFADRIGSYGISLVNRIDRGTSGLVMAAFTPEGAWHYSRQFAEGRAIKEYAAVVSGDWHRFQPIRLKHSSRLARISDMKKMASVEKGGEFALTEIEFGSFDRLRGLSVLKVFPATGRTHQIRVHLAEIGYPILGDTTYGGAPADRMYLHAFRLRIPKLGGGELKLKAELPGGFSPHGI